MSRLVLMNLRDQDVDVLTRLQQIEPAPEVVVVHEDPESLIVRLAKMAQIPTHTDLSDPGVSDVVVAPEAEFEGNGLRPWRDLGSRLISPSMFHPASMSAELPEAPALQAVEPGAEEKPPVSAVAPVSPDDGIVGVAMDEASVSTSLSVVALSSDALSSPEASFRFLAESALGEGNDAALWWDGAQGVWVPWVTVGDFLDPEITPPGGLDVITDWGSFRVVGDGVEGASWNLAALKRVAEDLALRDLAAWGGRAAALVRVPAVSLESDPDVLETWWDFVAGILAPQTAMLWREDTEGWSLAAARGKGVEFTGRLHLPEDLLTTTFPQGAEGWRGWEPVTGLRAYLRFADDDGRWPLRLARVQDAVAEQMATR